MHNFAFRWISTDPVTARIYDPPSLNKYTYVRNDPINKIDPDGRRWVLIGVSRGEGWYMEEYRWYDDYGLYDLESEEPEQNPPYDPREDFRDTAIQLKGNPIVSDCEALARLAYKAGQVAQGADEITRILSGGLTEFSNITWLRGRTASDAYYRVGVFRSDPHYNGGFGSSGFLAQYSGDNQVRHFVGWFAAGSLLNETAATFALYRTEPGAEADDPDIVLGLAAIKLGASFNGDARQLAQTIWHEICGQESDLNLPPIR